MSHEPTNRELAEGISELRKTTISLEVNIAEIKESNSEILEAIHLFAENMDRRFERIEASMATKTQLNSLIDVLSANKVITGFEARHIRAAT